MMTADKILTQEQWSVRLRRLSGILVILALVVMLGGVCSLCTGCGGHGLDVSSSGKSTDGDDDTDDDDSDTDTDDDDTPDSTDDTTTDLGTWIASYGDDWIHSDAENGYIQYVASVKFTRSGTTLSGKGTVFRVFNEGSVAYDKLTIKLSGTISGDDLTATVTSATGGSVYDAPTWRLRISGGRMTGMYVSYDSGNVLVRAGHALWYKVYTATVDGSWSSGYCDADGTTLWPARDRTATCVWDYNADAGTLAGTAEFVEQQIGSTATIEANVTAGEVALPLVGYTLGELDLVDNEMDWFSYLSSNIGVGAYAQYDADQVMVRYGHATWYLASAGVTPDSYSHRWVTAFTDTTMASASDDPMDYVLSLNLTAGEDNTVTGSGEFLSSEDPLDDFRYVEVEDSSIVGTHLEMTTRVASSQEYFVWDLRLTKTALVGSYQHFDNWDSFISQGTVEWRRVTSSTSSLEGRWVSSYVDTLSTASREMTQFVLVYITDQDSDGNLDGSGALRYGNTETGRRLFDLVDSSVSNRDIAWTWRGTDLFGDTYWRLRQAGSVLYGLYLNEDSDGDFESRGSAMWIKTADSGTL